MGDARTAVIVAPFWDQPDHVGVLRVERFVRWLSSAGIRVVVVGAGPHDHVAEKPWGVQVTVRDPLGGYARAAPGSAPIPTRTPNRLRAMAVNALLMPDAKIVWAKRAEHHRAVEALGRGANWVISSSPPESAHLAAAALARRWGAEHVVDMRDGWLDEPLKQLLQISRLQRWREGKLERAVLERGTKIFVVSDVLGELLAERLPFARAKLAVLTNCCPPEIQAPVSSQATLSRDTARPRLLYSGRFSGSNSRQSVASLFDPILAAAPEVHPADIVVQGRLDPTDIAELEHRRPRARAVGWSLEVLAPVSHAAALGEMRRADGLLLLAMARGVLTSKLFEYVSTGKPILAVALEGGALWRLGTRVPQLFLLDSRRPARTREVLSAFLEAAAAGRSFPVPEELTDAAGERTFLRHIGVRP